MWVIVAAKIPFISYNFFLFPTRGYEIPDPVSSPYILFSRHISSTFFLPSSVENTSVVRRQKYILYPDIFWHITFQTYSIAYIISKPFFLLHGQYSTISNTLLPPPSYGYLWWKFFFLVFILTSVQNSFLVFPLSLVQFSFRSNHKKILQQIDHKNLVSQKNSLLFLSSRVGEHHYHIAHHKDTCCLTLCLLCLPGSKG